jgi:succinate dehydrogenase / fumarate reductase flavoprotein subunit
MKSHDVIVVGGGFAGMNAAITAKLNGADVVLITKQHPLRSHSSSSHSGINAALNVGDSVEQHIQDTLESGDGLCDSELVEKLCREAQEEVVRLDRWGVPFSRDASGLFDFVQFGGSSVARTVFAGDAAGHFVLQVLYEQVLRLEIPVLQDCLVLSLIIVDDKCRGICYYDMPTGQTIAEQASAVVLATGGTNQIFGATSSALSATGDGMAMAYRQGVPLMDMEFVQFHPTSLPGSGLVITEMARSLGGRIVDKNNKALSSRPGLKGLELMNRNICSQTMVEAMNTKDDGNAVLFLDCSSIKKDVIKRQLYETAAMVKDLQGVKLTDGLIPITPCAHRSLGGIKVAANGATEIPGLFATGGCSCSGAHGANQLGGNALLDNLVYGRATGIASSDYASSTVAKDVSDTLAEDQRKNLRRFAVRGTSAKDSQAAIRSELQAVMQDKVGVIRDKVALVETQGTIESLQNRYDKIGIQKYGGTFNTELCSMVELGNLLEIAGATVASALARTESRGNHYRSDYPKRDDKQWSKHTLVYREGLNHVIKH